MRKIRFPVPVSLADPSKPDGKKWGLVSFLVERCLSLPENFTTLESCDRVFSLMGKLEPARKSEQDGKTSDVTVTDQEHDFLVNRFARGITVFASQGGEGTIPPHLVSDLALYARALHTAEIVQESSGA